MSVVGPRIQQDLSIGPVGRGWVTAMFTLSYLRQSDRPRR